ncbi:helix-turn-helix domain-containing protein [Solilutibacter silvestris]|uniref:helix-turn-helix domain-containing protein n=1 Tax=Solilutibacter silvestris TaxID=1645665 RepID=UPI003D34C154
MNPWVIVYSIGAAQAVLLALALRHRQANMPANRLLAAWLLLVGIDLATKAVFLSSPSPEKFRAYLFVAQFPLLHATLFYLYVRTLTTARPLGLRDAPHFIGFAVALVCFAPVMFASHARVADQMQLWLANQVPPPPRWHLLFLYGWSLAYVASALIRVMRYRRDVRERRSDVDRMSLRWLVVVALGQVAIWTVAVLHDTAHFSGVDYYLIYGAVAAWACALGYFSLMQSPVSPEPAASGDPAPAAEPPTADDPRLPEVQARLERLMSEEALYLEPALTIAQVARRSGYPEYLVSATINRRYGCTFWDYINRQRVDAARRMLADPEESRTILDIAYACGFTSKSTFNAAFKRETASTPSAARARRRQG